jgi:IS30 family transposase
VKIIPLNEGKTSRIVVSRFNEELIDIPNFLKISLTYDNGTEFTEHEHFTRESGMKVYFADPGCPGQRGTNENTNGLIREFFPKKTDFNMVKTSQIKEVERLLNQRPRKILDYRTPEEVMESMLKGGYDPPEHEIIRERKSSGDLS